MQLITETILRRAKAVITFLAVLAVIQTVLLASVVFGVLSRLQERQDDLAVSQERLRVVATASADSAVQAKEAAEATDRLLRDVVAGLDDPNPRTDHLRAQLDALCVQLLGAACPPPPTVPPATTTTLSGGE